MTNISPEKVKVQLEKILASAEFKADKQLSQFQRYVVEHAVNGHSGSIKQYTVAVEALGYGSDFDAQSNPTVRIEAGRLRRALERRGHEIRLTTKIGEVSAVRGLVGGDVMAAQDPRGPGAAGVVRPAVD